MFEEVELLNITLAIASIKKGEILMSYISNKKTFFALKKDRVFIQNTSSTFSLSIEEFHSLYKDVKFIIYDPSIEVEIDTLKDDEYYSWNVLKY